MGCEEPAPIPQYQDNETMEYIYRCPISIVNESSWFMIELFNYMEQGFLPYKGGVMDQPAHLIRRLSLVRKYKIKYEKDKTEKGNK